MFLGLAELPDLGAAIIAVKDMSKEDLECIAIKRLYSWQAAQMGPISPEFRRWVYSEREPDS